MTAAPLAGPGREAPTADADGCDPAAAMLFAADLPPDGGGLVAVGYGLDAEPAVDEGAFALPAGADADFTAFVDTHAEELVRFVRRRYPAIGGEAEDVVQETFAAMYRTWPPPNPVKYAYKAVTTKTYDELGRRARRAVLTEDGALGDDLAAGADTAVEAVGDVDFRAFLDSLPLGERKVAVLWFVHALTPSQIAGQLGVKVGAVKSVQHRIRTGAWAQKLRAERSTSTAAAGAAPVRSVASVSDRTPNQARTNKAVKGR